MICMPKKPSSKKRPKEDLKSAIIHFASCCSVIIILFAVSFNIQTYFTNQKVLGARTEVKTDNGLLDQKIFWEKIVSQNPTYRDGFLTLAQIENELGNSDSAQKALEKARQIDPNSEKIIEVEKLLNIQN